LHLAFLQGFGLFPNKTMSPTEQLGSQRLTPAIGGISMPQLRSLEDNIRGMEDHLDLRPHEFVPRLALRAPARRPF
jgi:hypothetical protein